MVRKLNGEKRGKDGPPCHALLEEGTRVLAGAEVENARREAEWLLADVMDRSRAMLYARPQEEVAPEAVQAFRERLRRRADGEPLQYVLGHADFFGLRLAVSPAVLIPRPETEEVVEAALRHLAGLRRPTVLDVGTGSGCIALALKAEHPEAEVYACDVSCEALAVARANAEACELDVSFFQADMLAENFLSDVAREALPDPFDLLVSNPPYVPEAEAETLPSSVHAYEPHTALFSGTEGMQCYRSLARRARHFLRPGGHVVFEVHAARAGAVAALLQNHGLEEVTVARDAFGKERIVEGRRASSQRAKR